MVVDTRSIAIGSGRGGIPPSALFVRGEIVLRTPIGQGVFLSELGQILIHRIRAAGEPRLHQHRMCVFPSCNNWSTVSR